ncbi:MAG: hypothetical protein ACAH21_01930 [Ramlibacter sp.]|nr:hypothetical protein [Ramlibacter sp.]
MAQPNDQLMPLPVADIPEFQRFVQQDYRKQALLEQTGGGDAFVEAAAPVIRKNLLQTLPYLSPSVQYLSKLRRRGVADEVVDRALARAWLDGADHFLVPRPRKRDVFSGTVALLAYSVVVALFVMIEFVNWLRHAHPDGASAMLGVPPLLALCGVPIVLVVFVVLRKLLHRS